MFRGRVTSHVPDIMNGFEEHYLLCSDNIAMSCMHMVVLEHINFEGNPVPILSLPVPSSLDMYGNTAGITCRGMVWT